MRAHTAARPTRKRVDPQDLFGDRTELPGEVVSSPPWEGIKQGERSLAGRSQEVGPGDF